MQLRSSSVPRNDFYSHEYGSVGGNPGNILDQNLSNSHVGHQRALSKDFVNHNITANAGKEILRSNLNTELMTSPSRPISKGPLDIPSQNLTHNASDSKLGVPAGSWKDYISHQVQIANSISQNEKVEQKLRALKYKETLDMMMQEEKKRKVEMRKDMIGQLRPEDPGYYEHLRMEKLRQDEERKKYWGQLEMQKKEKDDFRLREEFFKQQELQQNQVKINKYKEFEQHQAELEKNAKKQRFDEYKTSVEHHRQNHIAQRDARMAEKEKQYFLNDNEREQLFEKIRSKGFPNMDQYYHLENIEKERKQKYDEFIGKQIVQNNQREVEAAMRKEQMLKKLQSEALNTNHQQLHEKAQLSQRRKEEENEQRKVFQENKRYLEDIDAFEKELVSQQKKDYLQALKSQAHTYQQTKYNGNEFSSVERAINFRKQDPYATQDNNNKPMTSLPFVGQSHERTKQLRYLDNWLSHLPSK